ncbi:MAG: VOC family protein [Clostridia bacterium]|jgi:catechol 2,3-dioxygenase-like lactoylglutathione lyase family enzyme|nr:VOC family protein [Clostridia bacterium]MCI2013584.1 VOC family protein [Clostridia bacterium]
MKYKNTLLAVKDMEKSKKFYKEVLGLHVCADFGANVTLTGGISLQTIDTWKGFIDEKNVLFKSNSYELYFEEDNFDFFIDNLKSRTDIEYVHGVKEHSWGQRVVRIYDCDGHIIEIGENMINVVKRFEKSGLSVTQISERMDVPEKYVINCLKSNK